MADEGDKVSHGDILRAIGRLEGRLDDIHSTMGNNRTDISEAFRRLGMAEQRIAQGVIVAAVISLVMPVLVAMLSPRIEFGFDDPLPHPKGVTR
jgi:hypothetical protein